MAALTACFLPEEEREALRRSRQIDRQLAQERINLRQEIKILLLGAGESGKSTFIKQMRIIHGEEYTEQDRTDFRSTIYHNVLKGAKILVEARRRLQIPLENPENEANGFAVSNYHRNENLTPEEFHQYVAPLQALWADSGIQSTFRRSNEFQLVSLPLPLSVSLFSHTGGACENSCEREMCAYSAVMIILDVCERYFCPLPLKKVCRKYAGH